MEKCKICGSETCSFDRAKILSKYDVQYFRCPKCGFIQTEEPYWLEEAYSEAITNEDIGIIYRNELLKQKVQSIIFNFFSHAKTFLDWGGGMEYS